MAWYHWPTKGDVYGAASVKACYGHTEGAAGLHGVLCSVMSLQRSIAPPVMHLRNMNPYVAAAFADWEASSNLRPVVPRVRHTTNHKNCDINGYDQVHLVSQSA